MALQVLHRNDLPLGGFAGLTEHQFIIDEKVGGNQNTWNGVGSFVYLADARFNPLGETRLHAHKEIDVISVMVEGCIKHEGTLESGTNLVANQVQVQRAGAEGFKHNEINPDEKKNRMLQLWVLPEESGKCAGYKLYDIKNGDFKRIYGGKNDQNRTFGSHTSIEVGLLNNNQEITKNGDFLAYVSTGTGILNGTKLKEGDLIKGENLKFKALEDNVQFIVISTI